MIRCVLFVFALSLGAVSVSCAADDRSGQGDGDGKDAGQDSAPDDQDHDGGLDSGGGGDPQGCQKMDLLFVIDDSGSMACEQGFLTQAFPGFIAVLQDYLTPSGTQVAYRVGVTSTGRTVHYTQNIGGVPFNIETEGMDGALAAADGGVDPWIDGPGNQAQISARFTELASLGIMGPGYEMPLLSMKMALEKTAEGEVNEGFLRENALFIAVVITDEDDCSRLDDDFEIGVEKCSNFPVEHNLIDLQAFKDDLDARFGGSERYMVVAIGGMTDCGSGGYASACGDPEFDGAEKAKRLQDFINGYVGQNAGGNGIFFDICSVSLPDALALALEQMQVACDEYTPLE